MRKLWLDILWLLILLILISVMGSLLISGDVLIFLSPRMVPMVWFGFAVLIVLLIHHAVGVLQDVSQKNIKPGGKLGMLLFLIPALLFCTVTPNQSTSGMLPNQSIIRMNGSAQSGIQSVGETDTDARQESEVKEQLSEINGFLPCVLEDETTFFDLSADLFSEYLHNTIEELDGRTVTVYGFVYKQDSFPKDTVLISRMMLYCCAADASIVGFYVQLENAETLQNNEWIRVTGTVRTINLEYYGDYYDFPILTDGIVVRCGEPDVDDAYIYP